MEDWHLVTITSAAENDFIWNTVLDSTTSMGEVWLGAIVTNGTKGDFEWITGEEFTYSNFATGQPDLIRETVLEMGGVFGGPLWNDEDRPAGASAAQTFVIEHGSSFRPVIIDIKPGTTPNDINLNSKGVISVAILTTDSFDASQVDWETVSFGPNGAAKSHAMGHIEDVDEDGDLDLLLHFDTQDTGIACGDSEATLIGVTYSGQAVSGSDSVAVIRCGLPPQEPEQCVATRLVAANNALVACDPLLVDYMLEFEFADRTLYYDTRRDHIRETGWVHYSQQDCTGLVGLYDASGIGITNVYGVSVDGDVYVSDGTSLKTWTSQSKVLFAYGDHMCSNESLGDHPFYDAEVALDHTAYPTPYTVVPEAQ